MDFFNIIYNGYTIQSNFKFLTEFFVREFESANVKGYSFESFKEGIEVELSNMRYESRKPFFAEISELNSKHITFFLSNDLEQMKNIENEIQKLCYENCSLDLYKYSNPEFMGIVPDEDLENGFRMKTKKEFKKLQKAIGVKVLPYEGVIYYADIDIIENHLNDAYSQILEQNNEIVKEPQPIKENKHLSKHWFKIGVKFATGEVQRIYKENNQNATQTAMRLGGKNLHPYVSQSIANTAKKGDSNADKNIFARNQKDIDLILEYCSKNQLTVCDDFKKRLLNQHD